MAKSYDELLDLVLEYVTSKSEKGDVAYESVISKLLSRSGKTRKQTVDKKQFLYETSIGDFTVCFQSEEDWTQDQKNIVDSYVRKIDVADIKRRVKRDISKEYRDQIKEVGGAANAKCSLSEVLRSVTRYDVIGYFHDGKVSGQFLWVSYKDWMDGKSSISRPQVEYALDDNGSIEWGTVHIG